MSAGAPASLPHLGLLLPSNYSLTAAQGTYTVSGQAASLYQSFGPAYLPHMALLRGASSSQSYTLTAAQGTYAVTGQNAGLNYGYSLAADQGSFTLIGSDALADHEISAAVGTFTLTGQDAGLNILRTLVAETGTYTLTGEDATLTATGTFVLPAETGTFTLTGFDAVLNYGTVQAPGSAQMVRIRQLSWEELCRRSWGKEWTKRDVAYEFSNGRKFEEALVGGPYDPEHFED